jgi:Flp pilus assembly protein TadG
VLFALMLPALLGSLGLAIEVGFAFAQRQRMQAASDLAALNAANCMANPSRSMCVNAQSFPGSGGSAAKGMALAIAKADGYDATAVTVVTPFAGDVNRIQVSIAQPVATTLLSLLNFSSFNISGRAVAAVQSGVEPHHVRRR